MVEKSVVLSISDAWAAFRDKNFRGALSTMSYAIQTALLSGDRRLIRLAMEQRDQMKRLIPPDVLRRM